MLPQQLPWQARFGVAHALRGLVPTLVNDRRDHVEEKAEASRREAIVDAVRGARAYRRHGVQLEEGRGRAGAHEHHAAHHGGLLGPAFLGPGDKTVGPELLVGATKAERLEPMIY